MQRVCAVNTLFALINTPRTGYLNANDGDCLHDDLISRFGHERAHTLHRLGHTAVDYVLESVRELGIECDLVENGMAFVATGTELTVRVIECILTIHLSSS